MNHRTKALWIPGSITLALSVALLPVLDRMFPLASATISIGRLSLAFFFQELPALALLGALGAYFSWRAGGSLSLRLLAGLFPAFAQSLVLAFLLVLATLRSPAHLPSVTDVLSAFLIRVAIPAVALFLGTAPFLRIRGAQSAPWTLGHRGT